MLSEKPVGATTSDVKDIVEACRRNNVQFMDGVMFMHSRRLGALRRVLDDGQSVGTVRRITSQFTFGAEEQFFATNIRGGSDLEPLGCLGDLGWYLPPFHALGVRLAVALQGVRPSAGRASPQR